MPETVVITGGNGFVGQHLQQEIGTEWPQATVVTLDLPEVDVIKPETYRAKLAELNPGWLVHLAGIAAVSKSLNDPALVHRVNAEGTKMLLTELAEQSPQTKALVISSSDVYGGTTVAQAGEPISELPISECVPRNPYAESKLAMERIIAEQFIDRPIIVVRPFAHVGPGQKQGFVTADFAAQIAEIEKSGEGNLKVGNLEARRDFTDVRDVVRAYRLLMELGQVGETYHVASGAAVSIQQVLDELLKLSTADITVEIDSERLRPSDVPVLLGDASKLKAITGWEPTIPLKQSLQDILEYWRHE